MFIPTDSIISLLENYSERKKVMFTVLLFLIVKNYPAIEGMFY